MLGSYRGIFVALAGLVLTGASPPHESEPHGGAPNKVEPSSAPSPTYTPYAKYSPDPCYQDKDHDAADLCAQWRAAIAAEETTSLAYWGNWIAGAGAFLSFISIVLVVFALKQGREANRINMGEAGRNTRRAVSGSEDTREALRIAGKAAEAAETSGAAAILAQRPWIIVKPRDPQPIQNLGDKLQTILTIQAQNIGNSPAVRYVLASALKIVKHYGECDAALPLAWERVEELNAERLKHGDTLFPGPAMEWGHGFQALIGDTGPDDPIFLAGAGVVRFEFGNQIAHTAFRFVLVDSDYKPFTINSPAKELRLQLFKLKAEGEPPEGGANHDT